MDHAPMWLNVSLIRYERCEGRSEVLALAERMLPSRDNVRMPPIEHYDRPSRRHRNADTLCTGATRHLGVTLRTSGFRLRARWFRRNLSERRLSTSVQIAFGQPASKESARPHALLSCCYPRATPTGRCAVRSAGSRQETLT